MALTRLLIAWLVARVDIRSERAASAVEYALFLGLIAVVLILAVGFLGRQTARSLCSTC